MDPRLKYRFGIEVERRAADWLSGRGLTIVETNVRSKRGELDIVAYDGQELVFVEVRARTAPSWTQGIDALDPAKCRRFQRAITSYLAGYRGGALSVRADLMVWDGSNWSWFRNVICG